MNKKYKQFQRVDCIDQAINEATTINNFINELNIDLYKVNNGTLETINILDDGYIDFEFRSLFYTYKFIVGTGYFWRCRLQRNDERIGMRKLYRTSKGLYFNLFGHRYYLSEFIKKGGVKNV